MKNRFISISLGLLGALAIFALTGCGGFNGPRTSTITGTVIGVDFQPFRDANVYADGKSTKTTTTGAFQLENLRSGDVEVQATGFVNGTKFVGRTVIFNLEDAQQNNVNVLMGRESEVSIIRGQVRDQQGFLLSGASVFAYLGTGTSIRAVTDENGNYVMRDVPPGNYQLSATGRNYRSGQTTLNLGIRQDRTVSFTLTNPGLPSLSPPTITSAVTWVSHPDATRGPGGGSLAWARSYYGLKEHQPAATTRGLRSDMIVEADFEWNPIQFPDLLGFNVYRGNGASGPVYALDLAFDPLANYFVDIGLQPNSTYSYAFSTVATLYPDYNNSESGLSNRIVVETLNLLELNNPTAGPTLSWRSGSGATDYEVFIFDGFPTAGANFLYQSGTLTGLSYTYNGPPLQPGRTYYYIVLGTAFGGTSRTISQIGTFVP